MEFAERLNVLSAKVRQRGGTIQTEGGTKTALVMPFTDSVFGYGVFDLSEVTSEYICDIGTKKGGKIDYAILKDGQVRILIECKKIGEPLHINYASQFFRHFHVTSARVSTPTSGQVYKFFMDLDVPNKADEKPFLEFDLLDADEHILSKLQKLTKTTFDVDSIISAAGELKYVSQIKRKMANQFNQPDDDFVRFFATHVYDGIIAQKVREQFGALTRKAMSQFLGDQVNDRLKSAMNGAIRPVITMVPAELSMASQAESSTDDDRVHTTLEKLEEFHIVKAIVRAVVGAKQIVHRNTQSYFGVLLDDNNRELICRLHFNRSQKYIGLSDQEKSETRHPISSLDDIYTFADQLKGSIAYHE